MAEGKIVVCPQCGKKYKLKAAFDASSFSCTQCSATVPVKKKVGSAPASGRRRRGARGGRAARGAGKGRVAARGARGRRREPADAEEGEGRRGRYQKKDSSATVIMAIAGVIVIAAVILIVVASGDKPDKVAQVPPAGTTDTTGATDTTDTTSGGKTAPKPGGKLDDDVGAARKTPQPTGQPTDEGDTKKAAGEDQGRQATTKSSRKLGGSKKRARGKSRWDPPADLGHLEDTTPEMRKKIDALITTLIDVDAGRDSLEAKEALVALGKPAFPRLLGAMAKIRDTITDVDSGDERLIESSLKLADECLREMDGWLTAKGKTTLRPGSEKRYIAYICRLHYRRWMEVLQGMPEMPGPFDPSGAYEGKAEEYDGR